MSLPDPNLVPITPDDLKSAPLTPEQEAALLLETFGIPKVAFKAPRKQNANLKPKTKQSAASLLGDLLPPAPVNPRFVWTAVAIEFPIAHVTCLCGREYFVPMEPMCVWTRPHGDQRITNRRFPKDHHKLPSSQVVRTGEKLTGCFECGVARPTDIGNSPLGEEPTAVATTFIAEPTTLEDINDLLP